MTLSEALKELSEKYEELMKKYEALEKEFDKRNKRLKEILNKIDRSKEKGDER